MSASAQPSFISPGEPADIADRLTEAFKERRGSGPSVVAVAPGRVNLIGEHLDYNGGRCLPLALPHATYAALAPREDRILSVTSLQVGDTEEIDLDGLRPGVVSGWTAYVAGVVWALEQEGWKLPGLDVVVDSRVPIGSGLSSSAALECSVAVGLLSLVDVGDTDEVRRRLVDACIRAEAEMAGAPTGGMDQSVALLAQADHGLLLDFSDGSSEQVPWSPAAHDLRLLVVDTRVSHTLTDGGYASRRSDCEAAAALLGVEKLREVQGRPEVLDALPDPRVRRRAKHVLSEMDRVDAAVSALREGDVPALQPLLDASHSSLRDDFEVSCPELDLVVDTCREHGAHGARMTGGGFGGSALALLPSDRVEEAAAAVTEAFASCGWAEPGFLLAPASAGARLLSRG
ncbi:MAG TPA: galactokinase [Nocardioidaceae bacterium]|nr:galactokinase [Nocardioidaceae bacterium]